MSWSIPIGTVRGTVIRIHLTFLLLLLWIGVAHYQDGGMQAAVQGVVFISLVFLCVLLHEFGHVYAASRYGVRTPDITLLPIGGVARLSRIPEKPSQEFTVAVAGPLVNVVIAAVLLLALGHLPSAADLQVENPGLNMLARLATVNVFLVLFNLIPAFPMDGGRMLRALLAYKLGFPRATQVAASIGQALAFTFGLLGLVSGNVLLMFIALFVYLGAAAESHSVQLRQAANGMLAGDAMITRFETLSPSSSVADAVQALIRTTQHEFPVVDGAGRLRGVLTRDAMIQALRSDGPDTPVIEVMQRDVPVVHARDSFSEALKRLQENQLPALGVVDASGRLVGMITPENVGEIMMLHAARPPRREPPVSAPPVRNPWI